MSSAESKSSDISVGNLEYLMAPQTTNALAAYSILIASLLHPVGQHVDRDVSTKNAVEQGLLYVLVAF